MISNCIYIESTHKLCCSCETLPNTGDPLNFDWLMNWLKPLFVFENVFENAIDLVPWEGTSLINNNCWPAKTLFLFDCDDEYDKIFLFDLVSFGCDVRS